MQVSHDIVNQDTLQTKQSSTTFTMKTYDYNGTKVYLQKEKYRNNGTLAVLMFKEDGELYGCLTVNLNHPLQSDTLAFLDEKRFPGIRRWLTKNRLGEFTGYEACPGSGSYPLYHVDI